MNSTNRRKAAGSPAAGIVKVIAFIAIAVLIAVLLVCMTSGTKGGADTSAGAGRSPIPSATQTAKPDKTATPLQNIIESGAAEEQNFLDTPTASAVRPLMPSHPPRHTVQNGCDAAR